MPLWVSSSGNLIVGDSGTPVSCDECPCEHEEPINCYINVAWGPGDGIDLDISVRYREDNIGYYAGSKTGTYLNYPGAPSRAWRDDRSSNGNENVPVNASLLKKEHINMAVIQVGAAWWNTAGPNVITVTAYLNGVTSVKTNIHVSTQHNDTGYIPPNIATVTFDFNSNTVSVT